MPEVLLELGQEQGVEEVKPTEGFERPGQLHVGAATVEPGTGALRGFYGGQDYHAPEHKWAVAGGQAAAAFKPVASAARTQGSPPATTRPPPTTPPTGPGVSTPPTCQRAPATVPRWGTQSTTRPGDSPGMPPTAALPAS